MKILAKIPLVVLLVGSLLLGLAPLGQEPHLLAKINLLLSGELSRPVDIVDLLMHAALPLLLVLKLLQMAKQPQK